MFIEKVTQNPQPQQPAIPTQPVALQNNQESSSPQIPTRYVELKMHEQMVIDMRLLNYSYRVISKRLKNVNIKVEEDTLRHWFSKGGRCSIVFEEIRQKRVEELKKSIDEQKNQLQEATSDALAVLRTSLNKALESGVISDRDEALARDLLDRGGLPKQNKTDFSGNIESESMKEMASAIKGVLEQTIGKTNQP